ncbi:unnamed protein product [Closterium sp. NIES-54]
MLPLSPWLRVRYHPLPLSRPHGHCCWVQIHIAHHPAICLYEYVCANAFGCEWNLALPRQVALDSGGVGVGVGGTCVGGVGSEGAGAEGTGTGGARSGGAGAEGTGTGGAGSGGAGVVVPGAGGAHSGGARAVRTHSGGACAVDNGAGDSASTAPAPPCHCYPTQVGAGATAEGVGAAGFVATRVAAAGVAAAAVAAVPAITFAAVVLACEWPLGLDLPSSSLDPSPPPTAHGIPPSESSPADLSPPHSSPAPPVVLHSRVCPYPPRARSSSPVDDLRTVLLCTCSCHSPPESSLPSPLHRLSMSPLPQSLTTTALLVMLSPVLSPLLSRTPVPLFRLSRLGGGAVSWCSTRSSSVASSSAEAEIYACAMAAQELCWLTFLLTDLGERPSSAPTLFTDNKVIILLCREPRLESRVKHIDVRCFLF